MDEHREEVVSVIIPSYNAEKYVERCLRNIMNQTYNNIEIIIVDDGSSDGTRQVCENIKKEDSRIKYYYQRNSGVSVARNTGLCHATGKWIMFMDVDDQIDCCALEKALEYATKYKADTICWNCRGVYIDGKEQAFLNFTPTHEFVYDKNEKKELIKALYYTFDLKKFYPGQMFRAVWGKLLSKDVIDSNNILFPMGIPLGEDAVFLSQYFSFSEREVFVDEPWNVYSILPESAVGKYKENIPDLQKLELDRFILPIEIEAVEKNTILVNYCIECDRQNVLNFRKKETNIIRNICWMYKYICQRNIELSGKINYSEIAGKKRIVAFFILKRMRLLEAILSQCFKGI